MFLKIDEVVSFPKESSLYQLAFTTTNHHLILNLGNFSSHFLHMINSYQFCMQKFLKTYLLDNLIYFLIGLTLISSEFYLSESKDFIQFVHFSVMHN